MNRDEIEGKWKQMTGSIQQKWGELTGDEIAEIDGNLDRLEGLVQERYGKSRAEAHQAVEEWLAEA